MRMGKLCLLLIIGLLAGFTQTEEATESEQSDKRLICYHCDSTADKNCGEDFEKSSLYAIDCSIYQMPRHLIHIFGTSTRNATGCLKTITTINDEISVTRSCYYGDTNDTNRGCVPDPIESFSKGFDKCDVCLESLCNSSSENLHMATILSISFIFIRILL
ncbi:uncharacterized protein LOC129608310 isoform X3 [Condylostylus longicornis]|uniref:uncharacterized protein LOC129608310 isoform X3 n=1 Tax=Condylostylus longicornis TaxID=2530218 RepID=UPI00244DF4D9|nr:uncharacterized protein LOC129608310 isoform X3 [Condylostylus longicornis]XP_055375727.1 uncharacterized protein LOC129608310 isoform X3 [Condylostylus longicornis]